MTHELTKYLFKTHTNYVLCMHESDNFSINKRILILMLNNFSLWTTYALIYQFIKVAMFVIFF